MPGVNLSKFIYNNNRNKNYVIQNLKFMIDSPGIILTLSENKKCIYLISMSEYLNIKTKQESVAATAVSRPLVRLGSLQALSLPLASRPLVRSSSNVGHTVQTGHMNFYTLTGEKLDNNIDLSSRQLLLLNLVGVINGKYDISYFKNPNKSIDGKIYKITEYENEMKLYLTNIFDDINNINTKSVKYWNKMLQLISTTFKINSDIYDDDQGLNTLNCYNLSTTNPENYKKICTDQKGGSDKMYAKYLKYKSKYLKLKQQLKE